MTATPLEALPIDELRQRSSTKWRTHPGDVLPMFVAETDFALAPAISAALVRAVELGDTGYTPPQPGIAPAFVGFAQRRFGWQVDPSRVRWTCDVVMGLVEILRAIVAPGDRVIMTTPVYPPFFDTIPEAQAEAVDVPLIDDGTGWELDLDGIESAFAAGARAILLCNPHNPTGTVHSREKLAALAAIAKRHGGYVVSDEIHAPMTQPGREFIPFITASEDAAEVGFVVTSGSKTFNFAGLKCALMVTGSDATASVVRNMPDEVEWRTGLFGALATVAAFAPETDAWLDSLLARLDENRRLLASLLDEHVPGARYRMPDAGYLAWVDLSSLGWGENPAERILAEAKVALNSGPAFGAQGSGHVRINLGCSPEVLTEAVQRIGALIPQ